MTETIATPGKVYLIGAGPGAADLITVRGARILAKAEVVLYDALVTDEMLEHCAQAIKIRVGKRCARHSTPQATINAEIISHARQYKTVVRLKGGDPMLFGRADEELRALEEAGIDYEIIPGITAALAGAAATRQPLTQRGVSRSVTLFTSTVGAGENPNIKTPSGDTLVQYMGGKQVAVTASHLLANGYAPTTPVIVIEDCSNPQQRIERFTLATLAGYEDRFLGGPVLVMIGEAMAAR